MGDAQTLVIAEVVWTPSSKSLVLNTPFIPAAEGELVSAASFFRSHVPPFVHI